MESSDELVKTLFDLWYYKLIAGILGLIFAWLMVKLGLASNSVVKFYESNDKALALIAATVQSTHKLHVEEDPTSTFQVGGVLKVLGIHTGLIKEFQKQMKRNERYSEAVFKMNLTILDEMPEAKDAVPGARKAALREIEAELREGLTRG